MERLKNITIIFLLAVGLPASAAPAKSASVLLQEGLYAEEIEGDLDAAIKIYEQVIAQAKDTQRAAAQATYRIGMCYLKKGQEDKAAEYFQNIISNFPSQKALVVKAQRHLAKLKPPASGFGPAEPVPVDELIKSGRVPCFKVQLSDNTALDLDSGEIMQLLKDEGKTIVEWPDKFEVVWDNDGGGALMIKTGSNVRVLTLPSGATDRWEDAISMARSKIDMLRRSNASVIWPSRDRFAAVLTSEGNLSVIQIGEYNPEQGTIYGWIEKISTVVFGPVIERIIHSEETGKPFFFDLDTAKAFSPPPGLTRSSPEREVIEWTATKGIDFVNSRGHLELVEMTTVKVESDMWESATPAEIKDALLKGSTQNFLPTRSKDYTISSPITYVFKTREGGIGILQVLEKKDNNLRIRYKMLQEPGTVRPTFDFGPEVERIIYTDETGKDCFFDLDTGKAFSIPQGLTRSSDPEKGIPWILENGIDFVNCVGRLQLWDMVAVEVEEKIWDSEDAVEINSVLMRDPSKEFLPTEQEEYIITAPFIYAFETREGGIGLLQILEKRNTYLKIRYKMLQEPAKIAPVEVFGPVKVARLYDIDHPTTTEKECAIDFDTGKLSKIPPQARQMPGDDLMKWLSGSGIDAVAEIAGKDRGLIGIDVAVKTMPPYVWDKISPTELRTLMVNNNSARQETTPMLLEDEYQQVFAFRTRDSGLGILQILDVDKSKQMVQFRYKMLLEPAKIAPVEFFGLAELAKAAKQKIAAKHSRRLADTIAEMGWDLRTIEKAERGGDLRKSERFDKAEEMFKKALRKDPANASALKGLAVTCMERKEYGEAIKYYEMWLKAEPNNKDAKAGLEKAKAAKQQ